MLGAWRKSSNAWFTSGLDRLLGSCSLPTATQFNPVPHSARLEPLLLHTPTQLVYTQEVAYTLPALYHLLSLSGSLFRQHSSPPSSKASSPEISVTHSPEADDPSHVSAEECNSLPLCHNAYAIHLTSPHHGGVVSSHIITRRKG